VLLAQLAGAFQAPLVKAAGLFQAFTRNFAYGLKALVDQRVEGGDALEITAEPAAPETDAAPEAERPAPVADTAAPETATPETEATETATEPAATAETVTTEGE
jgi:large subunit ribosomal protein L10